MAKFAVLAIGSALVLGACKPHEIFAPPPETHIAVVGAGQVTAAPDFATIYLEVRGEGATSADAAAAFEKNMSKLLAVSDEFGELIVSMRSRLHDLGPEYESEYVDGGRVRRLSHFGAHGRLVLDIGDPQRAGEVFEALLEAGAESEQQVDYFVEDMASLYKKARSMAIENGMEKAKTYAEKLGAELGAIEIVEESNSENFRALFDVRRQVTDRDYYRKGRELYDEGALVGREYASVEVITVNTELYIRIDLKD